ncbi:MAG: hypothetical protein RLO80_13265 [Hyphomonas sp.]
MQTLKFEMAVAGIALFALGAFVATQPTDADAAAVTPVGVRSFTQADFDRFDRGFMLDERPCAVGLEQHKLCFEPSPLEVGMQPGMTLAADVPMLAAEFRIIVDSDLKETGLRTMRFGQTLVLLDPDTRKIVDMLRLTAPDPVAARAPAPAIG